MKRLTDEDITPFDIITNRQLYEDMIAVMEKVDGHKPSGACCGRNKNIHCEYFIQNKDKYLNTMEKIANKKIQAKNEDKVVFVSAENKFYNISKCTDDEILHLIEIGAVKKEDFIIPEVVEESKETKKATTKKK